MKNIIAERSIKKCYLFLLQIILAGILLIFFIRCGLACKESNPREYRETTNLQMADMFLHGENPYEITPEKYQYVNVYGFVYPMIVAAISYLTGCRIIHVFYWLYFLFMIISVVIIGWEIHDIVKIKKVEGQNVAYIGSVACSFLLFFRLGYISTIPDPMGIFLGILILRLARKADKYWEVGLLSVLTVVNFYVKPYFLFFAIPVFFFFLIYKKKYAFVYFISTFILGLGTLWGIDKIFPMFTIDTIYFEMCEQSHTSSDGMFYMAQQFGTMGVYFPVFFILILGIHFIAFICKKNSRPHSLEKSILEIKNNNRELSIYVVTTLCAGIVLLKLGQNGGAYLSYYLQLLMPSVLIIGTCYLIEIMNLVKNNKIIWGGILGFFVLMILNSYRHIGQVRLNSDEDEKNWAEAYEILDNYAGEENRYYLDPLLGYWAIENNVQIYDNGHDYIRIMIGRDLELDKERVEKYGKFFPRLEEVYNNAYKQLQEVNEMMENGEYKIVVRVNPDAEDVNDQYTQITHLTLRSGSQVWEAYFFAGNSDVRIK